MSVFEWQLTDCRRRPLQFFDVDAERVLIVLQTIETTVERDLDDEKGLADHIKTMPVAILRLLRLLLLLRDWILYSRTKRRHLSCSTTDTDTANDH